jgi:hypothetical protein
MIVPFVLLVELPGLKMGRDRPETLNASVELLEQTSYL